MPPELDPIRDHAELQRRYSEQRAARYRELNGRDPQPTSKGRPKQ